MPPRRRKRRKAVAGRGLFGDLGKFVAKEVIKEVAPRVIKAVSGKIKKKGRGLKLAGQGPRRRFAKRRVVRRQRRRRR